jgi:hypothetical protein
VCIHGSILDTSVLFPIQKFDIEIAIGIGIISFDLRSKVADPESDPDPDLD